MKELFGNWYLSSIFSFHRSQSKAFCLLNCTLKQRTMNLQKGKPLCIPTVDWLYYSPSKYLQFFPCSSRHISDYLKVQERDPKAHKFLGQLYEREGDINKAVGCYKVGWTYPLVKKQQTKPSSWNESFLSNFIRNQFAALMHYCD